MHGLSALLSILHDIFAGSCCQVEGDLAVIKSLDLCRSTLAWQHLMRFLRSGKAIQSYWWCGSAEIFPLVKSREGQTANDAYLLPVFFPCWLLDEVLKVLKLRYHSPSLFHYYNATFSVLVAMLVCVLLVVFGFACGFGEPSERLTHGYSQQQRSPSPKNIGEFHKSLRRFLSEQHRRFVSGLAKSHEDTTSHGDRYLPWFKNLGRRKGFYRGFPIHPKGKGKGSIEFYKETAKFTPIYHGVMPGTTITLLKRMFEATQAELAATRSIHDSREEFWVAYAQWIRINSIVYAENLDRRWARFQQLLETGKLRIIAAREKYEQAFESLQNLKLASKEMNKSISDALRTVECRQLLSSMRADKLAMKDLTGFELD